VFECVFHKACCSLVHSMLFFLNHLPSRTLYLLYLCAGDDDDVVDVDDVVVIVVVVAAAAAAAGDGVAPSSFLVTLAFTGVRIAIVMSSHWRAHV
jgi:hypothetical protein